MEAAIEANTVYESIRWENWPADLGIAAGCIWYRIRIRK